MEVKKEQDGHKGRYFIQDENGLVGEVTFSMAGDALMIIDHTHVEEQHLGKEVGATIIRAVVDDLRAQGIRALPLCPFANAFFKKHQAMQDVLS
jgi:predicted GNAT family acetyltransferase